MFRKWDELNSDSDIRLVTAGSKGEGITAFYENDHDFLLILQHTACILERLLSATDLDPADVLILMNGEGCHPGHFRLKLSPRMSSYHVQASIVREFVVERDGHQFLSSGRATEYMAAHGELGYLAPKKVTGPALPSERGMYKRDTVISLR